MPQMPNVAASDACGWLLKIGSTEFGTILAGSVTLPIFPVNLWGETQSPRVYGVILPSRPQPAQNVHRHEPGSPPAGRT